MTFEYLESMDEAARIARAALPLANKYELPANPINYAVFYEFVAGQNPELTKAMNGTLADNSKPSSSHIRDLYHTYISQTDEQAVEAVREALTTLVDSAGQSLSRMDGDSASFQTHLSDCAQPLKAVEPVGQLGRVIETLINKTEFMRASSSSLREELHEARSELGELRNEFKRVRQESLVDPLTGISNRRAFDLCLDEVAKTHAENQTPVCLLLLDVDHFKGINDRFGHVIGDAVLKWFAKVVRETVKGTDTVARYGGEEFAVLLPNTTLPGARIVAENIRKRVSDQKLRVGDHQIGRVTCSIGVAAVNAQCDGETWINNADGAMYRAKQGGRDRVILHGI